MALHEMMSSLPQPSAAQYAGFARHICAAHSWYKHLPLTGGQFVVFLAQDAGTRYPLRHPRLGAGENCTDLYRERFGHLDYLWRADPALPFDRDGGEPPNLPAWFLDRFGTTLYPYASDDGAAVEAICSGRRQENVDRLKAGASHPAREQLLRMAELYDRSEELWRGLTDEELAIAYAIEDEASDVHPAALKTYFALQASCHEIHGKLQAGELAKVERALSRLKDWLTSPPRRHLV
ncbi:hypothetical protein EP7_000846 [Isosphaeraceae bacterium EP7]